MYFGQRIFTESLFCLKHCAGNKESFQLHRQSCFRPECRAQTHWLFTATVHSVSLMPSLYQWLNILNVAPMQHIKRCAICVSFLEALLLYLCGKFLNKKEVWFCFTFFSEVPQGSVNSSSVNPSGTEGQHQKNNLGNMLTNPNEAESFVLIPTRPRKWKKKKKRNDGGGCAHLQAVS